eukprot:gb/GEZN01025116.1/.p1 GENE.gb/GEZN01025116.1/~~gb/GEZN01025116.1/.p1  ORF type:complete len:167 (+),score=32.12 gb/GEZN01025116.1/:2-502(+)
MRLTTKAVVGASLMAVLLLLWFGKDKQGRRKHVKETHRKNTRHSKQQDIQDQALSRQQLVAVLKAMLDTHAQVIARWQVIEAEVRKQSEREGATAEETRAFLVFQYHQNLQTLWGEVLKDYHTTEEALTQAKELYSSDQEINQLMDQFVSLTQTLPDLGIDISGTH